MPNNELSYTLRLKDLFSKTMQGAANQVKGLDGKMSGLTNRLSGLGTMMTGAFSIGAVVSFGKAVIESLKNYEYFHASLRTLLKGNENATKALESQLVNLAKTTPFELTEVQQATKQLMAYGFKAGDVIQTMRTLGDVSSGIGAPLGDIAYLYGTLKTSGRVTLMDLRQFAGRGIPIYETLAKRLNTTTNGINKMVHDGKLGFKDIEGAFKDMTKEGGQFFNLMADQSKTVGGRLSNLGDAWEQLKVNIGKSQSGIIAGTISFVATFVDALNSLVAAQNSVEQQMVKSNIKLSFWDKIKGNKEGLPSMVNDITAYQLKLNSITDSGLAADLKAFSLKKELNKLGDQRLAGEISLNEYRQKTALISGSLDTVKGLRDINSMKEGRSTLGGEPTGGAGGSSSSASLGSGTEVTGQRPQSLTINITKLVEQLSVNTTNLTEGTAKVKEMVSKALLEAVNDANLIAMT